MILSHISARSFRNLADFDVELSPGLNVVLGGNGAGKTSFLESIYFLGRTKSFKTRNRDRLIRHGMPGLVVKADIRDSRTRDVSIRYEKGSLRVRANGKSVLRASELVGDFGFRLVHVGSFRLLDGGPEIRRRFLDWLLFHVEPGYPILRTEYESARAQVNSALRKSTWSPISPWYNILAEKGEEIHRRRSRLVNELREYLDGCVRRFPGLSDVILEYRKGWPGDQRLEESLQDNDPAFRRAGFLTLGPHRADLCIKVNRALAHDSLSRGQLKMLIFGIQLLAELVCRSRGKNRGIFLIDDVASELDEENTGQLVEVLRESGAQAVLTNIAWTTSLGRMTSEYSVFHVEQGLISRG